MRAVSLAVRTVLLLGLALPAASPALAQPADAAAGAPAREEMADSVTGDPAAGRPLYNQCRACHDLDQERNRVGPHLVGLFGRRAGAVEGFAYSEPMRQSGIVWTPETLETYLADPRGSMPGNRMAFAGIRNPVQMADLIAYLFEATEPD